MSNPDATNEFAFVSAAANGIGEAIARELIARGRTVVGVDIQADRLTALGEELGERFHAARVDVTSEAETKALFASSAERFGRLTAAFNVVGGARMSPLIDMSVEDWTYSLNLTLTSTLICMKAEGRLMAGAGGGAIVNISSLNSRMPGHGLVAYSTAKAGVEMLTKYGAMELAQQGVRVNAVLPGLVATAATQGIIATPAMLEPFLERIPMGRAASAAEIAKTSIFLASPDASYVSGECLIVDGAWSTTGYPDTRLWRPPA